MDKRTLKTKITDLFINKEDDGTYNLFGKYIITPKDNSIYTVQEVNETEFYIFSSLKNAVTYCVFDNNNKQKEVQRIIELDELICSLDFIIQQHSRLLKKSDNENKNIYSAKVVEDKFKKKMAMRELEGYINFSRFLQSRKFNENQVKTCSN